MENCVFIDIFTTQNDLFNKNNCPIQFCCEVFANNEIYNNEKMFNPERRKLFNIIPDEDIMTSGYINSGFKTSDIKSSDFNGVDLKLALDNIYKLLLTFKKNSFYIIGYNHVNYDIDILNKNFKRVLNLEPIVFEDDHIIDVMKLAEMEIPVNMIGNYTMESVMTYLLDNHQIVQNLKTNKSTATDIKITKLILMNYMKNGMKFSDMVAKMNEPREIEIMSFGKYKGADVKYVFENDKQYCNWLIKNKDISRQNPNLINTLNKLLNTVIE